MPNLITGSWTVPANLPAAWTVRKFFALLPDVPKAGNPVVVYFWTSSANDPANPGNWSTPEVGTGPFTAGEPGPPGGGGSLGYFYEPNVIAMSRAGLTVVGLDQGNDYGAHRSEIPYFLSFVSANYGLSQTDYRAWCRSRGGLYGLNLAADMQGLFNRVGGNCCITDGMSYDPIGIAQNYTGISDPNAAWSAYNAGSPSPLQLNAPNYRAAALKTVPIFIGYGTADGVVPPAANVLTFAAAITGAGGTKLRTFAVAGAGHELTASLVQPLVDFMIQDNPNEVAVASGDFINVGPSSLLTFPGGVQTPLPMSWTVDLSGPYDVFLRAQLSGLVAPTKFWVAVTVNGSLINEQQTTFSGDGTDQGICDAIPAMAGIDAIAGQAISGMVYVFDFAHGPYQVTQNGAVTFLDIRRRGVQTT